MQRFSSEGLFAGEARSTGDGSGFVLGDFGRPTNIAVNRDSFLILDGQREIVHVFDAAVIHGIDDASAWVEYQSDSNFRGLDRFTFSATDGFRTGEGELLSSPPATVEINVARNFRPPDAASDLAAALDEDTPTPVTLRGTDLDGDNLTFEVTRAPIYGEISGTPPTVTYTPNPHYFGEDSFEFVAIDDSGHPDNRSQPELFRLVIAAQNDTPIVSFAADQLRTGAGYPLTLAADFFDPDPEEQHSVTVNWGDGTVERDGQVESDGTVSGPVIVEDENEDRQVVAYHTYAQSGQYTVEVCVTDAAGSTGCGQIRAVVEPMADLAIRRAGPYFVGAGTTGVAYVLTAVNQPPENGGGISASNVVIRETLEEGLRYATPLPNGCTADGATLRCTIGTLAPGPRSRGCTAGGIHHCGRGAEPDDYGRGRHLWRPKRASARAVPIRLRRTIACAMRSPSCARPTLSSTATMTTAMQSRATVAAAPWPKSALYVPPCKRRMRWPAHSPSRWPMASICSIRRLPAPPPRSSRSRKTKPSRATWISWMTS